MSQKPSIGRTVIYRLNESEVATNGGSTVAPAVITRVWTDTLVNLRILFDSSEVGHRTSVPISDLGEDENEGHAKPFSWYWPARV